MAKISNEAAHKILGNYRIFEQRRFWRTCANALTRQNLHCSQFKVWMWIGQGSKNLFNDHVHISKLATNPINGNYPPSFKIHTLTNNHGQGNVDRLFIHLCQKIVKS